MASARNIVPTAILVTAIALLLFWAATLQRQHEHFDRAVAAWNRGDVIAAVAGYEAAIHMYTPGSAVVERAAAGLWEIGNAMERKRDGTRALIAYRSLRSSFYAVRNLSQPGKAWIARCDAKIAILSGGETPYVE
jgi:hypothetical protein